jgi:hypothetical protein
LNAQDPLAMVHKLLNEKPRPLNNDSSRSKDDDASTKHPGDSQSDLEEPSSRHGHDRHGKKHRKKSHKHKKSSASSSSLTSIATKVGFAYTNVEIITSRLNSSDRNV